MSKALLIQSTLAGILLTIASAVVPLSGIELSCVPNGTNPVLVVETSIERTHRGLPMPYFTDPPPKGFDCRQAGDIKDQGNNPPPKRILYFVLDIIIWSVFSTGLLYVLRRIKAHTGKAV